MADDKPIIVVKKKGHHGGHHGGAWKVAYADFVTAMMAFFMVMWLLSQADVQTRRAIASYFRKPGIFENAAPSVLELGGSGILDDSYQPPRTTESGEMGKWELHKRLPTLKEEIEEERQTRLRDKRLTNEKPKDPIDPQAPLLRENSPENGPATTSSPPLPTKSRDGSVSNAYNVTGLSTSRGQALMEKLSQLLAATRLFTAEMRNSLGAIDIKIQPGLVTIEIMDTEETSMFSRGSAKISPQARGAFSTVANIVSSLPGSVAVLGHTDATPFSNTSRVYTNWELSTMRANEARRVLEEHGVAESRVISVIGKAATAPKDSGDPFAAKNRRITIEVTFSDAELKETLTNEEKRRMLAAALKVSVDSLPSPDSIVDTNNQLQPGEATTKKSPITEPFESGTAPSATPGTKASSTTSKSENSNGISLPFPTEPSRHTEQTPQSEPNVSVTPGGILNELRNPHLRPPPNDPPTADAQPPKETRDSADIFERFPVLFGTALDLF